MASVTVTVSTIDGIAPAKSLQAVDSKDIVSMTSSDNLTTGTALLEVLRWVGRAEGAKAKKEIWVTTQSYATVLAAVNAADAEAGAQLLAQKATTFATIDDDAYPTTEAVVEAFQPIWYAAATGTDTYAITLTGVVPTAYYSGMTIHATFANANSGGASTINVNALGAKAITKNISTALAANDIAVGRVYELKYDGTRFQIDAVDKEAIANKVTSISGASTDVQYPSAKLVYDTTQLLAPKASPTFTGPVIIETEAAASSNTRAASTAFVAGEFAAKFAKIASGALTAGVRTVNDAAIQATSIVTVQRIVTGGTAAVGGYKVTINAGVSVVITALQSDCVATETSCTDTVMALIHY